MKKWTPLLCDWKFKGKIKFCIRMMAQLVQVLVLIAWEMSKTLCLHILTLYPYYTQTMNPMNYHELTIFGIRS